MIKNFLEPKTIAVIGASENLQKVGFALMKNLIDFNGEVIPINPKHKILFARQCYNSVLDYKKDIDLAIIAIPAEFVSKILEQCGKKKIKNVIVITAGFSEIGNTKEEKKIMKIADKYKIHLLGPNCFGVANPYLDLDITFSRTHVSKGKIAFISQSGALWSYISDFSKNKMGFSGFVSLGNPVGSDYSDFIEYFNKDKKTKSIVLYIEKLTNGKRFLEISKKCKKKIYAVKAGSSKQGSKAAFSHTGSLATDYEIYKGAFMQSKIILCKSLIEAFEKAIGKKLLKSKKRRLNIKGNIEIITNAGGAGVLAADYLAESNIKANVKDILGTALASDYKKELNKHKKKRNILVIVTPQSMTEIEETAKIIINFKKENKNQIITCFLGENSIKIASKMLEKAKIPCFNTLEDFRKNL